MLAPMDGWDLRQLRREHGLTLRAVARASGTAQSNISAYERGAKRARDHTLERVVVVNEAGADSPVHRGQLLTAPATAAALRQGLRLGWSTADLLRLVREMRSNAALVAAPADVAAFFAGPSTTGDQRWDAMLAASVEDLCLRRGLDPPAWTIGHALPTFWFVGSSHSLDAYAFAHTPISMQVRGVMVDPADLEAV